MTAVAAPPPAPGGARAQLAALAASGVSLQTELDDRFPQPSDPRAAAVLMLFGVLDSVPGGYDAAAVSRDLDVLLLSRAATLRAHAGQVAFPGGRIDPTDTGPVAAALREAREETGLDPTGVDVLGSLEPVPLARSGHLVTPVLGWWRERSEVRVVDEAESADVFRTPVADLLDPARRGVTALRYGGVTWRGPAFRSGGHVIWGFTAILLDRMFDHLGWTEPWDRDREIPLAEVPGLRL